jgi:hypothetical protein
MPNRKTLLPPLILVREYNWEVDLTNHINAARGDEAWLKEYFEAVDATFTASLMAMLNYSPKPSRPQGVRNAGPHKS